MVKTMSKIKNKNWWHQFASPHAALKMKAHDQVHLAGVDTKPKARNNIRSAFVDPTAGSYSTRSHAFGIPKLANHTDAFHPRLLPHIHSNVARTGSVPIRGLKPVLSRVKLHNPLCEGVGATQIESHFFCKPGSASAQIIKKMIHHALDFGTGE